MSWPNRSLLELLGVELPIVQAPMAGASDIEVAVNVSDAGGLGSIPCALLTPDKLHEVLQTVRARTSYPVNFNFFCHAVPVADAASEAMWVQRVAPYYTELGLPVPDHLPGNLAFSFDAHACEVLEAVPPRVVSFHFGLPAAHFIDRLKAVGCKILSSATTVDEARQLQAQGCDAIIAQGYEAGGHRAMFRAARLTSQLGTLSLVPQVVDAVGVPVIAAGGIADGRGLAAAFSLGAAGAQLGTAYLFTREATISPVYRAILDRAANYETTITRAVSGKPARCVANRVIDELSKHEDQAPPFPKPLAAIAPLRRAAEQQGSRDFSALYAGQSAPLGYPTSAMELTLKLAADARLVLKRQGLSQPPARRAF